MSVLQIAVGLSRTRAGICRWLLDGLYQGLERASAQSLLPLVSRQSRSPGHYELWIHLLDITSEGSPQTSLSTGREIQHHSALRHCCYLDIMEKELEKILLFLSQTKPRTPVGKNLKETLRLSHAPEFSLWVTNMELGVCHVLPIKSNKMKSSLQAQASLLSAPVSFGSWERPEVTQWGRLSPSRPFLSSDRGQVSCRDDQYACDHHGTQQLPL